MGSESQEGREFVWIRSVVLDDLYVKLRLLKKTIRYKLLFYRYVRKKEKKSQICLVTWCSVLHTQENSVIK